MIEYYCFFSIKRVCFWLESKTVRTYEIQYIKTIRQKKFKQDPIGIFLNVAGMYGIHSRDTGNILLLVDFFFGYYRNCSTNCKKYVLCDSYSSENNKKESKKRKYSLFLLIYAVKRAKRLLSLPPPPTPSSFLNLLEINFLIMHNFSNLRENPFPTIENAG